MRKTEIDIEFDKALALAEELYDISRRISGIGNSRMDEAITLLTNSWKNESATTYIRNSETLKKRLYKSAEAIEDLSNLIKNAAGVIYAAEVTAITTFETRIL